jgi:hypothetical protein
MTLDPLQPRSRRGLLAAAGAAVAALAANAIGRPDRTAAATGDPVVAGQANSADLVTSLTNTTADAYALTVIAGGSGPAVVGASPRGNGVLGLTGTTSAGGQNGSDAGVFGRGIGANAFAGVDGDSDDGFGVSGTSGTVGVSGAGGLVGCTPSAAASRPRHPCRTPPCTLDGPSRRVATRPMSTADSACA